MYAVIKAGGKQQRVKPGDVIEVELMHGQHGEAVTFTPILVVDDDGKAHVGKDLGKATVKAKLVGEQKGDKVKILKYRPKTGYKKTQGHRQMYTLVEIQDVVLGRRAAAKKAEEAESRPAPEQEVEVPASEAPEPASASPEVSGSASGPEEPSVPQEHSEPESVGQPTDEAPGANEKATEGQDG